MAERATGGGGYGGGDERDFGRRQRSADSRGHSGVRAGGRGPGGGLLTRCDAFGQGVKPGAIVHLTDQAFVPTSSSTVQTEMWLGVYRLFGGDALGGSLRVFLSRELDA